VVIRWVPELCGRTVSRVPDIQFKRELFLRVPDVYIYLDGREKNLIRIILTSKRISAQSESPNPFLGFWVPTKTIHMPYLHGFEEFLNNREIIRKQAVKIQILVVSIFFLHFFC
jgi:hypothetical protein